MNVVRVFISSPGDVADERSKARQVIDQLQRHYGAAVQLLPVLWEDLPLQADASFQEGIDTVLSETHRIDVAVFILWSRLGSALGKTARKADGSFYRSGTEREFELMLAVREHSGGERPHILAYVRHDDDGFKRRLNESPADQLESLVSQRRLVEGFIREQFHDDEGRNLRAYHSYPGPISFAQRLRVHLKGLLDSMLGGADESMAPLWEDEPYRGLEVFDVEHASIFQGREEEVCTLEEILRRRTSDPADARACVIVVGASGSGKSSLVRAGFAASLTRFNLDESVKEWRHAVLLPGTAGGALFPALIRCLASALPGLREGGVSLDDLAGALIDKPDTAIKLSINPAFVRESRKAGGPVRLLLIVDQLEELWTDRRITPEDRERFLELLDALCTRSPVSVVATLRSDFYHQAHASPVFLRLKGTSGQYDLLPPRPAALHSIIAEPARLAALRFEQDEKTGRRLNEQLLEDALSQPDALPLLQYTLRELYLQRSAAGVLSFAAYNQMGGVEGALGRRAEATFSALPIEAQSVFAEVMRSLVTVNVDGTARPLRLRAPLARVTDGLAKQIFTESFIAQRFFTADREGDEAVVSIAHEALLRRWERLAGWVGSNQDALRLRARVEQSQSRWEQRQHPSLLLPSGLPLEEGRQLLQIAPYLLSSGTRAYITASAEFHAAAEVQKKRRRKLAMAALSLLTLVALAAAGMAWKARHLAEQQRLRAEKALRSSEALTKKLRSNADLVAANIAPLAYEAMVKTGDYNIKELASTFLTNTKGIFVTEYDPNSIQNSYTAALLCQCIANSELLADPDAMVATIRGDKISEEARKKLQSAAYYATKMRAILSQLAAKPDLDRYLTENGMDRETFTLVANESLLAFGGIALYQQDTASAISSLSQFVSETEKWSPKEDAAKPAKYFDLFEGYTNLSHALRLQGDRRGAVDAMVKALSNGEILADLNPARRVELAVRYMVADFYGELDEEQQRTFATHKKEWGISEADVNDVTKVLREPNGTKNGR